jgi:hypothetical protein
MNGIMKIMLCFAWFFQSSPEDLRSKIVNDFDKQQENNGYEFLWRDVQSPDKFHGYKLFYYGFKTQTRDEARKHLVINMEKILCALNSEKRLVETFYRYPLKPEDINLMYVNFQSEGVIAKKPYVSNISSNQDQITYFFSTTENIDDDEEVTESYNEAYEKVYGHPRNPLCEPKMHQSP